MQKLIRLGRKALPNMSRMLIKQQKYVDRTEYGYQADAKIHGKQMAMQVISKPDQLSKMEVKSGHLPKRANEIAFG